MDNKWYILFLTIILNVCGNNGTDLNVTSSIETIFAMNNTYEDIPSSHLSMSMSNESDSSIDREVNKTIVYIYPQTTTKNVNDVFIIYPEPTTTSTTTSTTTTTTTTTVEPIQSVDVTTVIPVQKDLISDENQSMEIHHNKTIDQVELMTNFTINSNDTSNPSITINATKDESNDNISSILINRTNSSKIFKEKLMKRISQRYKNGNVRYLKKIYLGQKKSVERRDNQTEIITPISHNSSGINSDYNSIKMNISEENSTTEHDLLIAESNEHLNIIVLPPNQESDQSIGKVEMIPFTFDDVVMSNKPMFNNTLKVKQLNNKNENEPKRINEKRILRKKLTRMNKKKHRSSDQLALIKSSYYPKTFDVRKNDLKKVEPVQDSSPTDRLSMWSGYMESGEPLTRMHLLPIVGPIPKPFPKI